MPTPLGTVHWPEPLSPQQATEPSASNATVWYAARGHARDRVRRRADATGDIALAVAVRSPAGDRAVREQRDGVVEARRHARDRVCRRADAAGDRALAGVVVSPAGDRAVREQRDRVVACPPPRSRPGFAGVPTPLGTVHWPVVVGSPAGDRAVGQHRKRDVSAGTDLRFGERSQPPGNEDHHRYEACRGGGQFSIQAPSRCRSLFRCRDALLVGLRFRKHLLSIRQNQF